MPYDPIPPALAADDARLCAALLADGDSRIRPDRASGLNKYLCPPYPTEDLLCLSSCTASPICADGLAAAAALPALDSLAARARLHDDLAARLLDYFAAAGLAEATLCPSGTDALQTAAAWLCGGRPDVTAVLPGGAETGSFVRLAVEGRAFDGPACGARVRPGAAASVEVPLRDADGMACAPDALEAAFAAAVARAPGRALLVLTHGSKTGLIAPAAPPDGCEVLVDACQARIAPATVARYLRHGWPVVVTGSKFFGGPAFCGAVLWPRARRPHAAPDAVPGGGVLLRWAAALATISAFAPRAGEAAALLRAAPATLGRGLAAIPGVVPMAGGAPAGDHWADLPSIFTFALRDPADPARLRSAEALRPVYRRLAARGVLVGQPVGLGAFGGLRIAIGARDLLAAPDPSRFDRLFAALSASV